MAEGAKIGNLDDILRRTLQMFGVSEQDFKGKCKRMSLVAARKFFVYSARKQTGASLREISDKIGYKGHSAVIYLLKHNEFAFKTSDGTTAVIGLSPKEKE